MSDGITSLSSDVAGVMSFASPEQSREFTGMELGGVTPDMLLKIPNVEVVENLAFLMPTE